MCIRDRIYTPLALDFPYDSDLHATHPVIIESRIHTNVVTVVAIDPSTRPAATTWHG